MNKSVPEVLNDAIALTAAAGTSPEILTNLADNYSNSTEIGALTTIGDALLEYYDNPDTRGVPLPMNDKTRARTGLYMDMIRAKVPSKDAEATVNLITNDVSEDAIQARKSAWDSPLFGSDSNETPAIIVTERINDILTDPNTEIGQTFVADIGGWFGFGREQYGDKTVALSPLLELELQRNSRNFYLATESENVAVRAPIDALRARGAAATDINYGQSLGFEDETIKYQIQINPITKSAKDGEIFSQKFVRSEIAKDLTNLKMNAQFSGVKKEGGRIYSVSEIEVGDGKISTYGPNKGNMEWPLKSQGGMLTHASGVLKDQPVYFYWSAANAPVETVEEPIKKDAAKLINKVESKNKTDRMDFSTTGEVKF